MLSLTPIAKEMRLMSMIMSMNMNMTKSYSLLVFLYSSIIRRAA